MSGAARDLGADLIGGTHVPRRPALPLSLLLDAAFATAAYLTAYWLRFTSDRLAIFIAGAWSTLPVILICQMIALVITGAYVARPKFDWLIRVIGGVFVGTAAATGAVGATVGFSGLSRGAFVADAMLLVIAAVGWRGAWVLRARARSGAPSRDAELVDRAADVTPLVAVLFSLYRYRELLKNLVFKDLKLKYRGSVFGFLWSLANPLLMIVVYTVAFRFILQVRTAGFVFYLMLGQLSWIFFANSASMSTSAIVENGGLLKTVVFPRAILPIGTVLFNLAQYLLTISVFLPVMMLWYRVPLGWPMLLFPILLVLQVVFTIGVALILSTWTAFFRDVRHLLEVALAMLFWLTPIVYELRTVPERFQLFILMSPMSPFIVAYQQMFYYREWPAGTVWLVAVSHAVGAFVVGALFFLAFEPQFAEQL